MKMYSPTTRRDYCQNLYKRILLKPPQSPVVYMWQLDQTKNCDDQHDLKDLRQAYRTHMSDDVYNRAVDFRTTTEDNSRIQQARMHHFRATRTQVSQGLSWPNWAQYQWNRFWE